MIFIFIIKYRHQYYSIIASESFLVYAFLYVLEDPSEIVGEVMALVVDESSLHDFKELLFSRVVYLSDLCFDLMKPIFNGIKLRGIRGQVKNVHITIFAQVNRLFFVMDSAIIKDQPFLSFVLLLFSLLFCQLLLFLEDSCEELLYEVQVFVLSISTLDYSPVSQSVLGNQGY